MTVQEFADLPNGTIVELGNTYIGTKFTLTGCDYEHYILSNGTLDGGHSDAVKAVKKLGFKFKYAYTITCDHDIKVISTPVNQFEDYKIY